MTTGDTRRLGPGRYLLDGQPVPSVTSVLASLAKPALVPWAAKITATAAVDGLDTISTMARDDAITWLKGAHRRETSAAAGRGTDVHRHAEALVHGIADDVPEELVPYVQSCARFLDRVGVQPVLVEATLFHRQPHYAGTLDLLGVCDHWDAEPWLFDYKTGSGIYPETALQLAAYRFASFYIDTDGTEQPVPPVVGCAAVHIRPDGWEVKPVTAGHRQWKTFQALLQVHYAMADADAWVMPPRLGEQVRQP